VLTYECVCMSRRLVYTIYCEKVSMKRRIYIYYLLRESEHKKVYVCYHISYGCVSILSMQRAYVKVRRYRCIAIDSKA
jgi:hypothetical protein